jgi:tRNA (cytidine/uridine-2'-O-)-methyltransferase
LTHSTRLAVYQPDLAHNLGSMIRLCACMGIPLDLIEPCGFPLSGKTLRESALDYGNACEIDRHDDWDAFKGLQSNQRLILLTTSAETDLWDFKFSPSDTLLVGRETAGVPDSVRAAVGAEVKIPMPGGGRSLNVAISAAMAVSECLRQVR